MMYDDDPGRLHHGASPRETVARDGWGSGERSLPPERKRRARVRARTLDEATVEERARWEERDRLEHEVNQDKRLGDLMLEDFQTAVELLLQEQHPRDATEVLFGACYLARVKPTAGRGYLRMLTSPHAPFRQDRETNTIDYAGGAP